MYYRGDIYAPSDVHFLFPIILQEICTLYKDADGSLGSKCIFRHDLGSDVIMNMMSSPNDLYTLAVGIDSTCQLMQIKKKGYWFL